MIPIKAFLAGLVGVSLCMANISGIVTDTGTTPIAGAVVKLETGGWTATTAADGSFTLGATAILPVKSKLLPNGLSAGITGNLMTVTIAERSVVEIATFDLNGRALSNVRQTMETGVHTVALSQRSAGVYLYKVKSGNGELLLKGNSVGGASSGSAVLSGTASTLSAKLAKAAVVINDVIAATKTGYLNYRCVQYNSDTTGIVIKMIASAGTVTDTDGNVYQTVRIGNQVWMAENLRVTKYNDGTGIPKQTDGIPWSNLTTPAYCYYYNTYNADSIKKFGALYNWYAVDTKKLAPAGWHVPTDSEWTIMENYLVLNGYNWDGTRDTSQANKIAKSLATKTDWVSDTFTGTICKNLTMNNSSGFSALPGGYRSGNGNGGAFYYQSLYGYWWSASGLNASIAFGRYLYCGSVRLYGYSSDKSNGYSVRLVKD